jgi:sensor histidine kinase YesM
MLQDKLRRLQAQLNPHFVYNAISSIAGIMSRREYDKAAAYLADFGKLLRETMNYSQTERHYTLAAELTMLQHYCRLEQMRFGFALQVEVDPTLYPEEVLLPPMLTHPLVENAIHHGVQGLPEGGEVTIRYQRQHNDLLIRVTDNGPGLKESSYHDGSGTGLYVTRERIKYLSQLYNNTIIEFELYRKDNLTVASLCFRDWME